MSKLRWPLIGALSLGGFAYAALTIFSIIRGYEYWAVLIILVGAGKLVGFLAPVAPARNGFVAGFLIALAGVWGQAAFLDLYFQNNPDVVMAAKDLPLGLSPRAYTIMFAPLGGLAAGVFTAIIAVLVAKIFRRKH